MGNWEAFNGMAGVYEKGRPDYPSALFDELWVSGDIREDTVIADIGAGTGKFARQLLGRGAFVCCVEPNDDMRRQAERELSGYTRKTLIPGVAEATTLGDGSVDLVTAAQAFHWFDAAAFRRECRRILQPGGMAFLVWNMRDTDAELVRRCYEMNRTYCPTFKGFGGGIQRDDERIRLFFDDRYERITYDHPLSFDRTAFIDRSLSGSYAPRVGDASYAPYVDALHRLFEEYARDGVLTMPNYTVIYRGRVG